MQEPQIFPLTPIRKKSRKPQGLRKFELEKGQLTIFTVAGNVLTPVTETIELALGKDPVTSDWHIHNERRRKETEH